MGTFASVGIVLRGVYDFSNLRDGVVSLPIALGIDVSRAELMTLEIWIHEGAFPEGSSISIFAGADGSGPESQSHSILQTRTAAGQEIARATVDSKTRLPHFQTLPVPVQHVPRAMAVLLEVTGGKHGPRFSLAVDLVLRESTNELPVVEPIVTSPDREDARAAAHARVAEAATMATSRIPRRYPRWREIVV